MKIEIKDIVQVIDKINPSYAKYAEVLEHRKEGPYNMYTIKLLDDNSVKGWFTRNKLRLVARANGKVIPGDSEDRSSEAIIKPNEKKKLSFTPLLENQGFNTAPTNWGQTWQTEPVPINWQHTNQITAHFQANPPNPVAETNPFLEDEIEILNNDDEE